MKISELLATISLHDSTITKIKTLGSELELFIDLCCQEVGSEGGPTPGLLRFKGVQEISFDEEVSLSDDAEILSAKVIPELKDQSSLTERMELLIQDGPNVVKMWISAAEVTWLPENLCSFGILN